MKLSNPLPQPLPKECSKAAKIFRSFVDSANNGLDGIIPRSVLENAKGFAIFTVFKAGFVFSARAGSGIVIAKLDDGSWSAPSAIGTAGVGFGGQAGAEMTDFLVVLNSRAAVRSFMAAGSLTLGGNMSIALGPLGRNGEATGALNTSGRVAAMYSYSKTRGLFGGVSLEGSVIMERQDANVQAYNSPVTARLLLGGMVDPPAWTAALIKTLETCTGMPGTREWIHDDADRTPGGSYAFSGVSNADVPSGTSSPGSSPPSFLRKKKKEKMEFPPTSWGTTTDSGSYFTDAPPKTHMRNFTWDPASSTSANFETKFESDFVPDLEPRSSSRYSGSTSSNRDSLVDLHNPFSTSSRAHVARSSSMSVTTSTQQQRFESFEDDQGDDLLTSSSRDRSASWSPHFIRPKPELSKPLLPHEGVARAIAMYNFQAVESGDLSFSKGDVIIITKKSDSNDDWWTGKLNGHTGIFPANFVEVV
ncbi:hypothetical protein BDQ17DRAFT_1269300 [Cyathus striatus]|nr:hypothetical protein BDQ17DRAFT_1269300 [Cyathus striatus]